MLNYIHKKLVILLIIFNLLLICTISILVLSQRNSATKIGYVDINQLLSKYEGMKEANKKLEQSISIMQSNADTLFVVLDKELKAFEKERVNMSQKEINLKQELLYNKQQQVLNYQEAVRKKADEEKSKSDQTVYNDINDYIKEYGEKKHYKFILGATGSGSILYADKFVDLTTFILEGINKEYKKNGNPTKN